VLSDRTLGFDVARSLAVIGMILVNFNIAMGEPSASGISRAFIGLFEGKAAALFVVLAGVGISLLSKRARESNDLQLLKEIRSSLLKRAVFLLIVGYLFSLIWQADILHYYAFYLLLSTVLLRTSNSILWLLIFALMVNFLVMLFLFDYSAGWNWNKLEYTDFWLWPGPLRNLLFNGFHPIFPWFSFVVFGLWLGRLNFNSSLTRINLLLVSLFVLLVTEGLSFLLIDYFTNLGLSEFSASDIVSVFGTSPIPPMPQYVISGASASTAVIVLCIRISELLHRSRVISVLTDTGRLALSIYIAHIVLSIGIIEVLAYSVDQAPVSIIIMTVVFCLFSMLFAHYWLKYFSHGPIELVMRKLTR
jgi:uncharacterized membrane protein YeiB